MNLIYGGGLSPAAYFVWRVKNIMRMRKKKYLDERLRSVGDILFVAECEDRNFNTAILEKDYINLSEWFGADRPLYLEIGCGKGKFAADFAEMHPEINILAVERDSNVIVSACEEALRRGITNLRFMKGRAEYLEKYLHENSVERIFLNFSCPFPKSKYASHRLTNHTFLKIYKNLLKSGAEIHQKTDNKGLFEFSIEQFSQNGFALKNVTLDLHNSDFEGNIVTEYEQRFVSQGLPIYRLEAYIP